jgi:hypothetical protein
MFIRVQGPDLHARVWDGCSPPMTLACIDGNPGRQASFTDRAFFCGCGYDLKIARDHAGFVDEICRTLRSEHFNGGFAKQCKPAFEVPGIESDVEVPHDRIAFVPPRAKQDAGPEISEDGEMMRPIVNNRVEDGADLRVKPGLRVERINQCANPSFGDVIHHVPVRFSCRISNGEMKAMHAIRLVRVPKKIAVRSWKSLRHLNGENQSAAVRLQVQF